jgi:cbb3-type cytochrome oxidase subunit 1
MNINKIEILKSLIWGFITALCAEVLTIAISVATFCMKGDALSSFHFLFAGGILFVAGISFAAGAIKSKNYLSQSWRPENFWLTWISTIAWIFIQSLCIDQLISNL